MTTIFIKLIVAALGNAEVQALLITLLQRAIGPAAAKIRGDIIAEIEKLPAALLGEAEKPIEQLLHEIPGTTDDIAGRVKNDMQPLLSGLGVNVNDLANELAAALKRLLPFPL
jgi:hypothetical protein